MNAVASIEKINSALMHVDSDDRDIWVNVGMALKSGLGESGFILWDEWSQACDSYDKGDAKDVWKSIKAGGRTGIGTLFHYAKERGWRYDGAEPKLTMQELEAERERRRIETKAAADAEAKKHAEAALKAEKIWSGGETNLSGHPYWERKGRLDFGKHVRRGQWPQRNWDDALLIPIYGPDGKIRSIEAINGDGSKDTLAGSKKSGGLCPLAQFTNHESGVVIVAEGVATAAACMAATGYPAVTAFCDSNLIKAAEFVKLKRHDARIVVAADIGAEEKARATAAVVGGVVAVPAGIQAKGKFDFWDVFAIDRGDILVRHIINVALDRLTDTAMDSAVIGKLDGADDDVIHRASQSSIDVHDMYRVAPMSWPHMSAKLEPLNTIPNLKHLLENYDITARYDVIRKDLIITHPGQCGSPDNQRSKAINTIKSLASLNCLAKTEIEQFLLSIGDDNQFNPVMDFISSKEWDGTSRFNDLLDTVTVREDFNLDLFKTLMRKWLISAVAAAAKPEGFWSKGVLVFQGEQSLGKTSWFRSLLPPSHRELLKVDAIINPDVKDTIISAVSHWLVELGELDATLRKADISRLKGFISQDVDQFRRPYGRTEEKVQRRSVFFASVNPEYFLVDDTGNVRWWTIPITSVNQDHDIDMQQLWAEVYTWFKNKEEWWLSDVEEMKLKKSNDDHQQSHPVDELIMSRYNFGSPIRRSLSTTEVLIELGFERPTKTQLNDATALMEKRFGKKVRSNGNRVYKVPPLRGYQAGG